MEKERHFSGLMENISRYKKSCNCSYTSKSLAELSRVVCTSHRRWLLGTKKMCSIELKLGNWADKYSILRPLYTISWRIFIFLSIGSSRFSESGSLVPCDFNNFPLQSLIFSLETVACSPGGLQWNRWKGWCWRIPQRLNSPESRQVLLWGVSKIMVKWVRIMCVTSTHARRLPLMKNALQTARLSQKTHAWSQVYVRQSQALSSTRTSCSSV